MDMKKFINDPKDTVQEMLVCCYQLKSGILINGIRKAFV